MNWTFQEYTRGDKIRNPIIGEFFSTEAIENPAEALVREGIQNAIDANTDHQATEIRILLVTGEDTPSEKKLSFWFDGLWEHIMAPKNGLREPPDQESPCPYLVFEDFGTTGLIGDINQAFEEEGDKNPFFYFFRAEGLSGKSEGDLGRWGIGKHVFPRSSRISTYFGFSKRADDHKNILLGCSILKSHKVQQDHFKPDGYYGLKKQADDLIFPITDDKNLDRFQKDFNLKRCNRSGLSIVVPFVDPDITIDHIRQAVISGYFYPILKNELIVDIETPKNKIKIDSSTLLLECSNLVGRSNKELIDLIGLAKWATSDLCDHQYLLRTAMIENPSWSDNLIPEELFEKLRKDFDDGNNVSLQVGIQIQEKGKIPILTYFDVYLSQDGFESGRPVFIRDGIIISDIHSPRSRGVRSLVVVSDKPLASLLGDSENPAHTQWQKDSSNFKNKYVKGKNIIDFVTKFVSNFVNAMSARDNEEDTSLLIDFFSIPKKIEEEVTQKTSTIIKPTSGVVSGGGPGPLPHRDEPFQLIQNKDGFKIIPSLIDFPIPLRLHIWVAYDLPSNNPILKYHPLDFKINEAPINFSESKKGISILFAEMNHLIIEIVEKDFQLVVNGFDENRDLYIKIDKFEAHDD